MQKICKALFNPWKHFGLVRQRPKCCMCVLALAVSREENKCQQTENSLKYQFQVLAEVPTFLYIYGGFLKLTSEKLRQRNGF